MENSMIYKDGSLKLLPSQVTWFEFLGLSRLTNSVFGGWNSKKYWVPRGLKMLSKEAVQQWTKNSFSEKALPKPRESEFMLKRVRSRARQEALDTAINSLQDSGIKSLTENQLNSVLHSEHWPSNWGTFLGYEVPLAGESDGQLKIDLLGTGDKSISVIELKQAKSPSNTPLMALVEAICYSIQIIRCKKHLPKECSDFEKIRIILAAPEEYWNLWSPLRYAESSVTTPSPMKDIVSCVSENLPNGFKLSLELYSLQYEKDRIVANSLPFNTLDCGQDRSSCDTCI